ncbi:MAG: YfcE family phosphodiesterase [Candidatus Hydrothermarchaeota archaeon]|nr:MAG: YfcE family phosphodiesterase [Candidatus Hydrothermarchaeota archaeon]
MKLGILSDTHIYDRARHLPRAILDTFVKEDVDIILHAGDLTSLEILDELKEISEVKAVQGNMDYFYGTRLPEKEILKINNFKILLFHGYGIYPRGDKAKLVYKALENGCNVIITGHTHMPLVTELRGVKIINPGSPTTPRYAKPTFAIAEIEEDIRVKILEIP